MIDDGAEALDDLLSASDPATPKVVAFESVYSMDGDVSPIGEICDVAGTPQLSLPVQTGSSPVSGKLVLNTLTIVAGAPVEILSATIG